MNPSKAADISGIPDDRMQIPLPSILCHRGESTGNIMRFPACKEHRNPPAHPARQGVLTWFAAEPFRLFFFSGAMWSIIGVSLWPLFYAGHLTFYPNLTHARLMIQTFGGAFLVGFLGTAGPRMATAPKLTPVELLVLFALHQANGLLHLMLRTRSADICFLLLLGTLLGCLSVRVAGFRKDAPPPQMLLALTGLLCGLAGTVMLLNAGWIVSPENHRLAGLLLYQGMMLPPVLGIGSFIFPRILGGDFGAPEAPKARRAGLFRALLAAALIIGSFFLETSGHPVTAYLLRAGTAAGYLLIEVKWRRAPGAEPRGTLARGLFWALLTGLAGLAATGFAYDRRVGMEHLLFVGMFGLLILIVGSRVLFGHSGELPGFSRRSWLPRLLIALAFVAATTRASAEFWPNITISHHKYAAWLWGLVCLLWLVWHGRRFLKRESEGD
jgi:uncharacterized protein involved in response to NO